jgi:hypothetical protein
MSRNYSSFADLCMMTSGGQPWALDMRQRNGNPALLGYLVNSTCNLLIEGNAFNDGFQRTPQGLMVMSGAAHSAPMAPAALVLLALRYIKGKMIEDGMWRPNISAAVIASCPELAQAQPGDAIEPTAAAHWSMPLISGKWLEPGRTPRTLQPEADYAPAR